jgi:hypothetical protein
VDDMRSDKAGTPGYQDQIANSQTFCVRHRIP